MKDDKKKPESDSVDSSVASRLAAANIAWPESAGKQMANLIDQIGKENSHIQNIIGTEQSVPIKAGFSAEEMHASTYNLEMILQGKSARALTDRYPEWYSHGMKHNDPSTDIMITNGGKIIHKAQVKYYQDSHQTANAMRETRDGTPYYKDADSFIGPSDQVRPTDGGMSISDHAHRTRLQNAETRPPVAEAAGRVEERVTDRLDKASLPSSKHEAHEVARDRREGQELRDSYHDRYMTRSTIQQMQRAATSAAGIAAVIAGTLNTIQYLRLVHEGRISHGDAVLGIVKNTAVASADSALKAAAAAGVTSVATRFSAGTIAEQTVNSMVGRSGIAGAAICAVDLVECMVLVAAGKMTPAEMETRTGKNVLQTAAGVWGSSIGISIAASLGVTAGVATVLSGMAGGMIAAVAISIAIENHIEQPYKEIMANTALMADTAHIVQDTAEAMSVGQYAFAVFLAEEAELSDLTTAQLQRIDSAGGELSKAIDRLR